MPSPLKGMLNLAHAVTEGIDADQQVLRARHGRRVRPRAVAYVKDRNVRAGVLFRLSARGGIVGTLARRSLLRNYGCDVSAGCRILGGLYLPHPLGIVLGQGVVVDNNVGIYQGVTLGAGAQQGYPTVHEGATLFPNSMVVGAVTVGAGARIGAHALVSRDVDAEATVRGPRA